MSKKFKFKVIFIFVLIITAAMSAGVSAASAEFLDIDETTRGDWVGNYGSEGHMLISSDNYFPKKSGYASVDVTGQIGYYEWWSSGNSNNYSDDEIKRREAGALFKNTDKTNRIAGCYYAAQTLMVNIDVGNETKIVSLYMHDYDEHGRMAKVYAYDDEGGELIEPVDIDMYDMGVYLRFKISGAVYFMLENVPPVEMNVCLSGIFFDPDTSEPSETAGEAAAVIDGGQDAEENKPDSGDSDTENKGNNDILVLIIAIIAVIILAAPVIAVKIDEKKMQIN